MEITPENIIVNSCEFTPVYLIPSPSVSQAGSYLIKQNIQEPQKPVTDNLKRFYENSGNLENSLLNSRPRILKRQTSNVIGNNLKLASFLLPKTENFEQKINNNEKQYTVVPKHESVVNDKVLISNDKIIIHENVHLAAETLITNQIKKQTPKREIISVKDKVLITNDKICEEVLIPAENIIKTKQFTKENIIKTKQFTKPVHQVVFKPPVGISTKVVPSLEIKRKIVRVGNIPKKKIRLPATARPLPKIKLEENSSKLTSVQLLKLGETYHSLNQLSDDQMKIVNKALKIFSDPEKIPEPAYDPVTNTKFIYKVVSPRDLTVVGKNKEVLMKNVKKYPLKKAEKREPDRKPAPPVPEEEEVAEPTVTRSGRTVKAKSKQIFPEDSPQKPKKRAGNVISCFQCSAEFCSLYRLQRHYECYPTHVPEKIHSNLFHCLIAIIKGGSEEDQANMFIQQLEHLIEKLKSLLPCLLKKIDGCEGALCHINNDIGRLFNMNPGQYNLNMEALNCVKETDGHCVHNPPQRNNQFNSDMSKPSQIWLSKHNEEIANNEAETEDCARIHPVDKWPTVSKRIWKIKQQKSQKLYAKKMRLVSENEPMIELGTEDTFETDKESAISLAQNISLVENKESDNTIKPIINNTTSVDDQSKKPKDKHIQFHSAHFDIRSSPIKHSALVRKFQINPDKMSNYEVQVLRPLENTNENSEEIIKSSSDTNLQLQEIFRDSLDLPKDEMNNELSFDNPNWTMISASNDNQSHDTYMKSNILFEPSLTHDKGDLIEPSLIHVNDKSNGLFDQESKSDRLIESLISKADIESLHNKDDINNTSVQIKKFNSAIDSTLLYTKDKCNDLFGTSLSKETTNSLFEPSIMNMKDESNGLFDALSHVKERSRNLFEPSRRSSLFEPLIHVKEKSNIFVTSLPHKESNNIYEQSMINEKDDKSMNVDMNQSELSGNDNDSRLLSNQGQSVLNFLDSLGNDCLSYPETEIRNNSVDFQLDLFSFNSS